MCPKHLLGDFVFVIWDENKQQLFCARDHIGIKPFYYHLSDDLFVFSNDIRGLVSYPGDSKRYNNKTIAMFLAGDSGCHDERDTFFEAIQKLPAASSLTITKDIVAESIYWDFTDITEVHYDTFEEYTEKLKELLCNAVQARLRTVYPVASHLSGRIDTSAIAVLAARELEARGQPLYAFNWVETPEGQYDPDMAEWGFAAQLASQENIEQKNIRLTADFISKMYDKIDISKDDISYFWGEYLVRDEAERCKVRIVLSGWGGDELISYNGYAYFSGLFWQGHFIKAIKAIYKQYKFRNEKYICLRIVKRSLEEMIRPFLYRITHSNFILHKNQVDNLKFTQKQFASFAGKLSFISPCFLYPPQVSDRPRGVLNGVTEFQA